MTWEEYKKQKNKVPELVMRYKQLDVECPICGNLILQDRQTVLTSYPPMFNYFCEKCGWKDFGY